MSRDQKPGKVRHVGVTQDRRQSGTASATDGAVAATAGAVDGGSGAASAPSDASAAKPKGGIGLIAILMFLVFAGVGGGGIVALAPTLGLWP